MMEVPASVLSVLSLLLSLNTLYLVIKMSKKIISSKIDKIFILSCKMGF